MITHYQSYIVWENSKRISVSFCGRPGRITDVIGRATCISCLRLAVVSFSNIVSQLPVQIVMDLKGNLRAIK